MESYLDKHIAQPAENNSMWLPAIWCYSGIGKYIQRNMHGKHKGFEMRAPWHAYTCTCKYVYRGGLCRGGAR